MSYRRNFFRELLASAVDNIDALKEAPSRYLRNVMQASALGASVLASAKELQASDGCTGGSNTCDAPSGENYCLVNSCTGTGGSNTCPVSNTCESLNQCGALNTCARNYCETNNSCGLGGNTCSSNTTICSQGQNSCVRTNICSTNVCAFNSCTGSLDSCSGAFNNCPSNACSWNNNCTKNDSCQLNECPNSNTTCGLLDSEIRPIPIRTAHCFDDNAECPGSHVITVQPIENLTHYSEIQGSENLEEKLTHGSVIIPPGP